MDTTFLPPQKVCLSTETHFFITRVRVLPDFDGHNFLTICFIGTFEGSFIIYVKSRFTWTPHFCHPKKCVSVPRHTFSYLELGCCQTLNGHNFLTICLIGTFEGSIIIYVKSRFTWTPHFFHPKKCVSVLRRLFPLSELGDFQNLNMHNFVTICLIRAFQESSTIYMKSRFPWEFDLPYPKRVFRY
jgi:hypothetical protein